MNESGQLLGPEITVRSLENEYVPSNLLIATTSDGRIVVGYVDRFRGEVHGKVYDADGTLVSDFQFFNSDNLGFGENLITPLAGGGFLVTAEGTDFDFVVKAGIFDSNGVQIGATFDAHSTPLLVSTHHSSVALTSGGFVITWTTDNPEATGTILLGQRFDGTGTRVGGEFFVNTTTNIDADYSLTSLPNDGFAVTWNSNGDIYEKTSFEVSEIDGPPVAEADKTVTVVEDSGDTPLSIVAPSDPNGDPLIITVTGLSDGELGTFHYADGTPLFLTGIQLTETELTGITFRPESNQNGTGYFSYTVTDGNGGSDSQTVTIQVTPVNDAPTIVSNISHSGVYHGGGDLTLTYAEDRSNTVDNIFSTDIDNTDAELTYTLSGTDAARFTIDSTAIPGVGILTFNAQPDFEIPTEVDGNNAYDLTVTVSDGAGGTDVQNISVVVANALDIINGTPFDDVLVGTNYAEVINGLAGNDVLYGFDGDDVLNGDDGDDYLDGGAGRNNLSGGAGNDALFGLDGYDVLNGDDGEDYLDGGAGRNALSGGAGNDRFRSSYAGDELDGGANGDRLDGSGTSYDIAEVVRDSQTLAYVFDLAENETGILTLSDETKLSNIEGIWFYAGSGDDQITTLNGNYVDLLYGNDGNDTLSAGGGNDVLDGGAGDDTLDGGTGDGHDTLWGGSGNDLLLGGAGDDVLWADSSAGEGNIVYGNDVLYGGAGNDYLVGDSDRGLDEEVPLFVESNDLLFGGDGDDLIFDSGGNNTLDGGAGNDSLQAYGAGNDILIGGEGDDFLAAFAGDKYLDGGVGLDTMYGGDGDDTLISEDTDAFVYGLRGIDFGIFDRSTLASNFVFDLDSQIIVDNSSGFGVVLADQTEVWGIERMEFRAGSGNDNLSGGGLNDTLVGNDGNDTLVGRAGDDVLDGGAGTNFLTGGAGNDTLIGAASGSTTAVFSGMRNNYLISPLADGRVSIADQRGGSPDGTDVASRIQFVQFSDGIFSLETLVNTAPQILDIGTPGQVSEDTNPTNLTTGGLIRFDDANLADSHTVSVTTSAINTLGGVLTAFITDSATGAGDGTVTWNYSLANSAAQFLAANQSRDEHFDIMIDDGHGGSTSQRVTVTITGTNDAPTITASLTTASGSVTEQAEPETGVTHSASGSIAFADVDSMDTHIASATAHAVSYLGTFSLDSVNQVSDTVGWNFSVADSALDNLRAGQIVNQSYNVSVIDGNGGSATQTVSVTLTGTNDAATITGTTAGAVVEDGASSASGALTVSDVDTDENQVQPQSSVAGAYGNFSIDSSGAWSYSLNDALNVQALAGGQNVTDSFSVTSVDHTATQDVTISIVGSNDAATITGTATGAVTEDAPINTASGDLNAADIDNTGDTWEAVTTATTSVNGYGSFVVNAAGIWTFTLDNTNAAVQALNAGSSLTDGFEVLTIDGTAQTVTITIAGADEPNTPPLITSNDGGETAAISINENTTAVTDVNATDADLPVQTLTYAIEGGADASKFAINAATGVLSFISAPNAEIPQDANGDNTYDVVVLVADEAGATDIQTLSITVADVNEFAVGVVTDVNDETNSVAENSAIGAFAGIKASANDADRSNNTITYSLTDNAGGRFSHR